MCAAADPDKIIRDIEATIETAKKLIANPPRKEGYSEAEFKADLDKGLINSMKLGDVFSGGSAQDDELKKHMMKIASQINATKSQLTAHKLPEIAWDKYESAFAAQGIGSDKIEGLKSKFAETEKKFAAEIEKFKAAEIDKSRGEINSKFDGPAGITAQFINADKKIDADRVASLAQLEGLLHESSNMDTLTIAEILEKNPEWQAAIEEDIKNHNWGSEPPAALVQQMEEAAAPKE